MSIRPLAFALSFAPLALAGLAQADDHGGAVTPKPYTTGATLTQAEALVATADRIAAAFLVHIEASVAFYEGAEQAMFGRPIAHVLLLHANQLNADQIGRASCRERVSSPV